MQQNSNMVALGLLLITVSACVHAPEFQSNKPLKYNTPVESLSQNETLPVSADERTLLESQMKVEGLDVTIEEAESIETMPKPAPLAVHDLFTVPPQGQKLVQKWIDYFQGKGRHHMERYLGRLGRYEEFMTDILAEEGVPKDLIYVALIESGFNKHAHSHASAVGYWQFIRSTGKAYGLTINSLVDERKNPEKATLAAAQYYKALYKVFGSWPLALSAYNAGENRVMRAIMRNYTRDFWTLALSRQLPRETVNYFPKFVAASMICKNPQAYGFGHVERQPKIEFDKIALTHGISMSKLAENLNIPVDELKDLNPSFNSDFVPLYSGTTVPFLVPKGLGEKALAAAENSQSKNKYVAYEAESVHRVRRGDNVGRIARRYGTSVSAILAENGMTRRTILYPGMRVRIPNGQRVAANAYREYNVAQTENSGGGVVHRARRGDTLSGVASRYRVGLSKLARINGLSVRSRLKVGQRLRIP
jgi:membrane-bound lytic murein transglycosylase D